MRKAFLMVIGSLFLVASGYFIFLTSSEKGIWGGLLLLAFLCVIFASTKSKKIKILHDRYNDALVRRNFYLSFLGVLVIIFSGLWMINPKLAIAIFIPIIASSLFIFIPAFMMWSSRDKRSTE
jgi:uncharacterized membrane protein